MYIMKSIFHCSKAGTFHFLDLLNLSWCQGGLGKDFVRGMWSALQQENIQSELKRHI